ncbi:hypothetical protein ATKI12_3548 [Kitasatospora sp. Ki12]
MCVHASTVRRVPGPGPRNTSPADFADFAGAARVSAAAPRAQAPA